jgi:hypothetical protein
MLGNANVILPAETAPEVKAVILLPQLHGKSCRKKVSQLHVATPFTHFVFDINFFSATAKNSPFI